MSLHQNFKLLHQENKKTTQHQAGKTCGKDSFIVEKVVALLWVCSPQRGNKQFEDIVSEMLPAP